MFKPQSLLALPGTKRRLPALEYFGALLKADSGRFATPVRTESLAGTCRKLYRDQLVQPIARGAWPQPWLAVGHRSCQEYVCCEDSMAFASFCRYGWKATGLFLRRPRLGAQPQRAGCIFCAA